MAIHAITGVMGSGKSYEAVSEKIIVALRDQEGRRVITNIEGLQFEKIAAYLKKPLEYVQEHLITISYDRVSEPGFWYDPEGGERDVITNNPRVETTAISPPVVDSVVQPGDLVVLDEVWRYFGTRDKLLDDAMRFFRMHRHYVSEKTSLSCDVVLINQALRGIHRDIRDVVELEFACRKMKAIGRPQNYQVYLHEGGDRKASHSYFRKYRSEIYDLYSSYSQANAKESIDSRQNALSKPFFKYMIPLSIFLIVFGMYYIFSMFSGDGLVESFSSESPSLSSSPSSPVPVSQLSGGSSPSPQPPASSRARYRVAAMYQVSGVPVALVVDDSGVYRTITPGSITRGASSDVYVSAPSQDKEGVITPWSIKWNQ